MKHSSLFAFCFLLVSAYLVKSADGVIISPCTVRNLVAQPEYGTSLRTKGLVPIVQIPPVFVQNVMVGICENQNQNISTGRAGEFYTCQQRYSVLEVYVADTGSTLDPYQRPNPSDNLNNIRFVRESVIIESGCDFTFNLLPLIANAQSQQQQRQQAPYVPPEQKMFLKSPYHPVYRQPPGSAMPVPAPPQPQGVPIPVMDPSSSVLPSQNPAMSVTVTNLGGGGTPIQMNAQPSPTVTYATQGRAGSAAQEGNLEEAVVETEGDAGEQLTEA